LRKTCMDKVLVKFKESRSMIIHKVGLLYRMTGIGQYAMWEEEVLLCAEHLRCSVVTLAVTLLQLSHSEACSNTQHCLKLPTC
jgi:hypothetical protein